MAVQKISCSKHRSSRERGALAGSVYFLLSGAKSVTTFEWYTCLFGWLHQTSQNNELLDVGIEPGMALYVSMVITDRYHLTFSPSFQHTST